MNASKTEFNIFTTPPKMAASNSQLTVSGSNEKFEVVVKTLDIIINSKLTFETQIEVYLKKGPWRKSNSNNSQQPTQKMSKRGASWSCL